MYPISLQRWQVSLGSFMPATFLRVASGRFFQRSSFCGLQRHRVLLQKSTLVSFPKTQMDGKAVAALGALVNTCDILSHAALTEPTWNLSLMETVHLGWSWRIVVNVKFPISMHSHVTVQANIASSAPFYPPSSLRTFMIMQSLQKLNKTKQSNKHRPVMEKNASVLYLPFCIWFSSFSIFPFSRR